MNEMADDNPRPMLRVQSLQRSYGKRVVLRDVTFDAAAGSVIALLGSNGAGKTTALKCILGVLSFGGEIEIDGRSVKEHGKEARKRIGYVPQLPALAEGDTCQQALEFIADLKGASRDEITPALDMVNLAQERAAKIGELSGGMRQRLAVAAAVLGDPPVLLLDEPTASLDIDSKREFQQLILRLRDEGRTIIVSTHFFEHLEDLADRVLILHDGRVAFDGTVDELAAKSRSRRLVVNLNGHSPAETSEILERAGIDRSRIQRVAMGWEDIVLATQQPEENAQ